MLMQLSAIIIHGNSIQKISAALVIAEHTQTAKEKTETDTDTDNGDDDTTARKDNKRARRSTGFV